MGGGRAAEDGGERAVRNGAWPCRHRGIPRTMAPVLTIQARAGRHCDVGSHAPWGRHGNQPQEQARTQLTRRPSISDRLATTQTPTGVGAPGDGDPSWLGTDSAAACPHDRYEAFSWPGGFFDQRAGGPFSRRGGAQARPSPNLAASSLVPEASPVRFSRGCLWPGPPGVVGGTTRAALRLAEHTCVGPEAAGSACARHALWLDGGLHRKPPLAGNVAASVQVAQPRGGPLPDPVKRGTRHRPSDQRNAYLETLTPFGVGGAQQGEGRWPGSIAGWGCVCHNGGALRVITQWRAEFAARSLASRPATCRGRLPVYKPGACRALFLPFRRKERSPRCVQ